jgi:hypothetical protein
MSTPGASVALVFGDVDEKQLHDWLLRADVWLAETPRNERAARHLWDCRATEAFAGELTTFAISQQPPESQLPDVLELLDDHYNEFTEAGPWQQLHLVGKLEALRVAEVFESNALQGIQLTPYGALVTRLPEIGGA